MAKKETQEKLKAAFKEFGTLDRDKIYRPNLGDESLERELRPKLEKLQKRVASAFRYAEDVPDTPVNSMADILVKINRVLAQHIQMSNPDYINDSANLLNNINHLLEDIKSPWQTFVLAALEASGIVEDGTLDEKAKALVRVMRETAEEAMEQAKQESSRILEEAQSEAAEIVQKAEAVEHKARRTATGISIEDAQEQFRKAKKHHIRQVILWAILSVASIWGFIWTAFYFLEASDLPNEWKWQILYYTALRVVILTAIAAVSTFCLRILRAHMHMHQHDLHRERITNSMEAFVEAAETPEQRDRIRAHLVDAVCTFGRSGILEKEDDSIYAPKMTIDNVTRSLVPPSRES